MIELDRTRLIGLFFFKSILMRRILLALTFLFILSPIISVAQKPREKARANIVMLKNGALFVRLRTSELKINALKSKGMLKEAEEIRVAQENTNKSIIAAFKANFKFCPVYFFYSNYSTQIKEGNYKGLIMDVNMQVDSSFSSNNYLIGEFDESETTQLDAFIIKDKNYEQLRKPFPFFIKQTETLVVTRSYDKIVYILSKRLFEYYSK